MPNTQFIIFAYDEDTGAFSLQADVDDRHHFRALAELAREAITRYLDSMDEPDVDTSN